METDGALAANGASCDHSMDFELDDVAEFCLPERAQERRPGDPPAARALLVSDLDWTLYDETDPSNAGLNAFTAAWQRHLSANSLLAISTGRSVTKWKQVQAAAPLPVPDILILGVGTEIHHRLPKAAAAADAGRAARAANHTLPGYEPDEGYWRYLSKSWDHDKAAALLACYPQLQPQEASEQSAYKLSYEYVAHTATGGEAAELKATLSAALKAAGIAACVIFSGAGSVDVLPARAGKGRALRYLLAEGAREAEVKADVPPGTPCEETLDLRPERLVLSAGETQVVVAGDSGNDVNLFELTKAKNVSIAGIAVGNAMPELVQFLDASPCLRVYRARRKCAAGVLEGLTHYGLLPAAEDGAEEQNGAAT